jgi:hypothetical protein
MKSKNLISVFFILTTLFSFSQVPTQQWLTVINDSTSTNDLFYWGGVNPNNSWYSKFPFILNATGSKIAVTNNSGNQPTASVLNTSDGSIIFSNTQTVNSNAKDLDFDNNDNLYTISSWNETNTGTNTGFVRKFNQFGSLIGSTNITSNCQDNLLTIKNSNNKVFVYNRNKSCSNLNYHTAHCFDTSLTQIWSNSSTDIDWYYSYDSRMIVDNSGNLIAASKKQTTQSQVNSYNIIIRKIEPNGQTLWQTSYDFNNKMDHLANGNSLTIDSNNDIYFVDLNSSNWSTSSTTSRLVKINGQTGQIVFDQQITTRTGVFGGSEPIFLISVGNQIVASSVYKVESFNSLNGSLNWSQSLGSGSNYIQNISYKENKIFVTTSNGVIVLDTLGNTLYNLNVTISGQTVKHLHTVSDTTGNIFVVGYRTINNINKVFVAKFSTCSVFVNAGQDLTVCEGETVTLNASGPSNLTWSDNVQNGVSFSPQSTHTYFASVPGCSVDSVTVFVNQKPSLVNGPDVSVCRGSFVNLQGQNYFSQTNLSYNWSNNVQDGVDFYPTMSNTYVVTAVSPSGCSSSDSVTVTIHYASDTVISTTTCSSYILNNEVYTESGIYTQILTNTFGCDSVITLKLSILNIPSTPILSEVNGQITTQSQSDVNFQWVDCSNGSFILNANDTVFTPTQTGSFSVVASNECGSVQSDCITINVASIDDNFFEINVYPNPTQDFIQIDGLTNNQTEFQMFDSNGKLVLSGKLSNKEMIDLTNLNSGLYQLFLNKQKFRIIKL